MGVRELVGEDKVWPGGRGPAARPLPCSPFPEGAGLEADIKNWNYHLGNCPQINRALIENPPNVPKTHF